MNRIVKITKKSLLVRNPPAALSPLAFSRHHLSGQLLPSQFPSLPFEEFGFRLVLALTLTDKHGKQSVSGFEVLSVDLLHSDVL